MKKKLMLASVGLLLVLLFNQKGFAQNDAFEKGYITKAALYSISAMLDTTSLNTQGTVVNLLSNSSGSPKESRKAAREIKGMNRAIKSFGKDFKEAENVKWSKDGSGFSSSFMKDGVHTVAFYSNWGSLVSFMRNYTEEKLPEDISSIISDNYEGYRITGVDEIHKDDILVYLVHLESDKKIKLVTVCNGEINIYKELNKSK